MQIHIIRKRREPLERGGRGLKFERVAQMDFAEADVVLLKSFQRVRRFLELDGEMTGVVVHAEMRVQSRVARMFVAQLVEELHRLRAVLEIAERLRFKTEMEVASGSLGKFRDVFDAAPDVVTDGAFLSGRRDEVFERTGQRADAALDIGRNELREQVEEARGVVEAARVGPVRQINIFLHARAVELAVGKTIDRENVAVLLIEPALKREQRFRIGEITRRDIAQAQADGVTSFRRDTFLDAQGVRGERVERFRPRLAAMDVGAVGEVESVLENHAVNDVGPNVFWKSQR